MADAGEAAPIAPAPVAAAPTGSPRDQLIAKFLSEPAPAAPVKAPSAAPVAPPASPSAVEADAADLSDDDEADADVDTDVDADAPAPEDLKGAQAIKRAEVRMRQDFAEQKRQLEAAIGPKLERLAHLEKLISRGKYDTDAVVELLGLSEDDYEPHAQGMYARSPKLKDNPKAREIAAKALRDREGRADIDSVRQRLDAMEKEQKAREQDAAAGRAVEDFVAKAKAAVDDKSPLAKRLLEKNPARAEFELASAAASLWQASGKEPSHAAVVKEVEKRRRAELADMGVDADTISTPAAAAAPAADAKAKAAPAAAPVNGKATHAAPVVSTIDRAELIQKFAERSPSS